MITYRLRVSEHLAAWLLVQPGYELQARSNRRTGHFAGPRTRTLNQAMHESLHAVEHNAHLLSDALAHQMQTLTYAFAHPSEAVGNLSAGLPHNMSSALDYLTQTFYPARVMPPQENATHALLQQRAVQLWQLSDAGQRYIADDEPGAAPGVSTTEAPAALTVWLKDVIQRSVMWPVPRWPFYLFMAGAMTCLFCSTFCHLLACCNRHVSVVVWRFDYAGALCAAPQSLCLAAWDPLLSFYFEAALARAS